MSSYENRTMRSGGPRHQFTGVVTYWNFARGFGFLRRGDGQPDVFCHITQIVEDVEGLVVGDRVSFTLGINSKNGKSEARDVRLMD